MSLRLHQAVPGRPNQAPAQSLATVTVDGRAFIVYISASNVVVLDHELELHATLPLWDALPFRSSSSSGLSNVEGVSCADSLIIAWSGVHVVLWSYSSNKHVWNVHSTVSASSAITAVDFREGLLALATKSGLELWKMNKDGDVVVWDRLWQRSYPTPSSVEVAPGGSHLAWNIEGHRSVFIMTLDRKGQPVGVPQELRHPREIEWIGWRRAVASGGDAYLYTITSNSVFRIYAPVLDDPTWFQLLSSVDHRAFLRHPAQSHSTNSKGKATETGRFGTLWALDAEVLRAGLLNELERVNEGAAKPSAMTRKIMEGLATEETDVVACFDRAGNLSLRSVANLDRKPPTLIKSLPLSRIRLPTNLSDAPKRPQLLHVPATSSLLVVFPSIHRITAYRMTLSELLASSSYGFAPQLDRNHEEQAIAVDLARSLKHFVRTPNGRGLLAIAEGGEIGVWSKEEVGKPDKGKRWKRSLAGKGYWSLPETPARSAIFAKGRAMVFYHKSAEDKATMTLQHIDRGETTPAPAVYLPNFRPKPGDDVKVLLAVSDIDDGFSGKTRRTERAIIMAVTKSGEAWCWRVISKWENSEDSKAGRKSAPPDIKLLHQYRLSPADCEKDATPHLVLPVDPMGWHQSVIDWKTDMPLQDMVLTVSSKGKLEFWQPALGHHLAVPESVTDKAKAQCVTQKEHVHTPWTRSGFVDTGKEGIVKAGCSSRKKTAIVCEVEDGRQEITIWDSNVSEFATGLEMTYTFEKGAVVRDLDWTTTSDLQSVLAVGFAHKVVLVCEQRMNYVRAMPGWAPFITVDLEQYTSVPINDSIWLAGGSLAVGAGNQIYLFSRYLDRESPTPSPAASSQNLTLDQEEPEDIFQLIAAQNGPLQDYHPVVLAQSILWNKMDLVKKILASLATSLQRCEQEGRRRLLFERLEPEEYYSRKKPASQPKTLANKYDSLFDTAPTDSAIEDDDDLNDRLVADLIDRLEGCVHVPLSYAEKTQLATVAQATLEAERQRRSLDISGLRFLVSIRMVANAQRRFGPSGTATPASASASALQSLSVRETTRLSFRNIVWAMHSESQDVLLSAATECCPNGKMLWDEAKRLGVFLWLKSTETIKSQLEIIARLRFMADEDRDPTSCSLIFFALGKKKVLHGLWRQAPGHKEQAMMLKFLSNDFELERWKSAAVKNAYALLSKQRYEYAAAFFMLANQPKDAITVCLRQLDDWQLAFALARVVEPDTGSTGSVGPLGKWILTDTVIPLAFAGGHRWLATWAFWLLGRRDLAVRVLISPLADVASSWSPDHNIAIGESDNDDPSLLLLFQHLKSKSLQTAKGTSEIPSKVEFDFVLHNARVFFRMGCHSLALDLLRSWSFDRPFFPQRIRRSSTRNPSTPLTEKPPVRPSRPALNPVSPSYSHMRRPSFMLSAQGRRESMVMDMDMDALVESGGSTRVPSPAGVNGFGNTSAIQEEPEAEVPKLNGFGGVDGDLNGASTTNGAATASQQPTETKPEAEVQPKKMGNLMKELKQDVTQGAMEFDMDSFF